MIDVIVRQGLIADLERVKPEVDTAPGRGETVDGDHAAMSLDVYLKAVRPIDVFEQNITHNLNAMAEAAGLYKPLWRPEEVEISKAEQLIQPLRDGLAKLRADPERFRALNPANGWGNYEGLCVFVAAYLAACEENPDADVRVSR